MRTLGGRGRGGEGCRGGACTAVEEVGPGGSSLGAHPSQSQLGHSAALERGQVSSLTFLICKVDLTMALSAWSWREDKLILRRAQGLSSASQPSDQLELLF